MNKTHIQWTDESWNPITGCKAISEGCANCYAARLSATRLSQSPRYKGLASLNDVGRGVWNGKVNLLHDKLLEPFRKTRGRKIFVCDMSDLFYEEVPFEFIDKVWATMAFSPQHTFQVLTKRPGRMLGYLVTLSEAKSQHRLYKSAIEMGLDPSREPTEWPLPNVWCGTSIESMKEAGNRLPALAQTPAAVRFLSLEPLLEEVLIDPALLPAIHWVVVGGESGKDRLCRGCDVWWVRSIVRQCAAAKVPVFVKQLGSLAFRTIRDVISLKHEGLGLRDPNGGDISEFPSDIRIREFPK